MTATGRAPLDPNEAGKRFADAYVRQDLAAVAEIAAEALTEVERLRKTAHYPIPNTGLGNAAACAFDGERWPCDVVLERGAA